MPDDDVVANTTHEQRLAETFVDLADTMVDDFDVVDFLHLLVKRCVELLGASHAGLLLAGSDGHLQVMAASDERSRLLELFQLQNQEGPCFDCYTSGLPVTCDDLDEARDRWPQFAPAALDADLRSVHALPMRSRDQVLGALNLFRTDTGGLSESDEAIGQAMAGIATIGLLQERSVRDSQVTATQLQGALDSRVVVEQAKGVLSEQATLDMGEAFDRLRTYARSNNRRLSEVAAAIVAGELSAQVLAGDAARD